MALTAQEAEVFFTAGQKAYDDGFYVEDCPLPKKSEEAQEWIDGWRYRQQDDTFLYERDQRQQELDDPRHVPGNYK
jgi:ribosome modulation factor